VAGTVGTGAANDVLFVYPRLIWDAPSRCALVLPNAASDWYALRFRP
jgi:hypothetical protein